jgi:hypothetical protein
MSAILTELMKKTILDLDLIDTGALYNSIQVTTQLNQNELIIIVESEDYIKFHVEDKDIVNVFLNQPGCDEEFGIIIFPWIENGIRDIFEGRGSDNLSNLKISVLFNP